MIVFLVTFENEENLVNTFDRLQVRMRILGRQRHLCCRIPSVLPPIDLIYSIYEKK